jgi:ATP-dependent exoDNAse (exonuclease V) beta subunit
MNSDPNKPLLVLNASAGSGKTYNLVRNYLVLLLKDSDSRAEPGQVIAMTFTNKAAYEMKTRIIRDLSRLANPGEKDASYVAEIALLTGLEPEKLQKSAQSTLKKMLHRYEDFNVMTLDKFNLRLIRSFSRDLNLPENFEIAMDEQMVLEKAVDELLSKVDEREKTRIYNLAVSYARTNLDEEEKWNVKKALMDAGAILREEQTFNIIRKLVAREFNEEDRELWKLQLKELTGQITEWQNRLKASFAEEAHSPSVFAGGTHTYNAVVRMQQRAVSPRDFQELFGLTEASVRNLRKTIEKSNLRTAGIALELHDFWLKKSAAIIELNLKIRQFYLLSILRELAISMEKIHESEQIIRISEFNKLISDLVRDEDAPFIYEKIGSRFRHFFLDEFQDTSLLQWQNLVPLVHESLSNAHFNLIVGDPKQSIYRFKNGVAQQFVELPGIYNPENHPVVNSRSAYFTTMGRKETLGGNYRSCREIVSFNNMFFEDLRRQLTPDGQEFYSSVSQEAQGPAGGYVSYAFTGLSNRQSREDFLNAQFIRWIGECIADGYKPIDICVLGRTKKDCNAYANFLRKHGFQVVSSDSLMVSSDIFVQLVMAFCEWRNNPRLDQLGMRFAELYFRVHAEDAQAGFEQCFTESEEIPAGRTTARKNFSVQLFFGQTGISPKMLFEPYQDLYSLIQNIVRRFGIDELANAYVHQLLDMAAEFDRRNGPDLAAFLAWFDSDGKRTNVQLPENENSIQIMTAHKSKGLEFPVVIIPSLRFNSKGIHDKKTILDTGDHFVEAVYNSRFGLLSGMEELIEKEKDADFLDGVNLLYVAFTRPVDRLYFSGSTDPYAGTMQKLVFSILGEYPFHRLDEETNACFGEYGSKPDIHHHQRRKDRPFRPVSLTDNLWFPEISLMSAGEKEETDLHRQRRLGRQFHLVMERSNSKHEAFDAIARGILKGTVEKELEEELKQTVERLFRHAPFIEMVSGGKQLDERTLLVDERMQLRPDKTIFHPDRTVVIDFKTGERKAEHLKQVRDYVFSLDLMHYPSVEGYLYYVNEDALVKVDTGV